MACAGCFPPSIAFAQEKRWPRDRPWRVDACLIGIPQAAELFRREVLLMKALGSWTRFQAAKQAKREALAAAEQLRFSSLASRALAAWAAAAGEQRKVRSFSATGWSGSGASARFGRFSRRIVSRRVGPSPITSVPFASGAWWASALQWPGGGQRRRLRSITSRVSSPAGARPSSSRCSCPPCLSCRCGPLTFAGWRSPWKECC